MKLSAIVFRKWNEPARGDFSSSAVFQYLDIDRGSATVSGFVPTEILPDTDAPGASLVLTADAGEVAIPLLPSSEFRFSGKIRSGARFSFAIDDSIPDGKYRAALKQQGCPAIPLPFATGPRFPLCLHYRNQCMRLSDGRSMQFRRDGRLHIFHESVPARLVREMRFLFELLANRTLPEWVAAATRLCYFAWRPFHNGRYWIFSDKLSNPIDSAYSIAKALIGNDEFSKERITPFYLVDGRHALRARLPEKLRTVRYLSLRHRLLFLAAEVCVTSEDGYAPLAPLAPYSDISARQIKVSSLHGIVHHDLSGLYGRDSSDFNLMLTGVRREAEYERSGLWGYAPENVVCTGLPRWDDRENAPARKICFAFTWRTSLVESSDPVTKEYRYGALLEDSEYRKHLNSLLANPTLRELASRQGYTIEFLPHPLMRGAMSFFEIPNHIHVVPEDTPYEDVYREASILVTDYSSVAMDMAYLGKPVVYYQFDHDAFYATQGYTESYFSWKADGFGPVTTDEDSTVAAIAGILDAGCRRAPEYECRAKAFFPPADKLNGFRACRAIFARIADWNVRAERVSHVHETSQSATGTR